MLTVEGFPELPRWLMSACDCMTYVAKIEGASPLQQGPAQSNPMSLQLYQSAAVHLGRPRKSKPCFLLTHPVQLRSDKVSSGNVLICWSLLHMLGRWEKKRKKKKKRERERGREGGTDGGTDGQTEGVVSILLCHT